MLIVTLLLGIILAGILLAASVLLVKAIDRVCDLFDE